MLRGFFSFSVFFVLLASCASHTQVNDWASELKCDKIFHFSFDESSNIVKIEYKGVDPSGHSEYPDYKRTFIESVEDLAEASKMNLFYKDALGFPSDSIIKVKVKIRKIIWTFYNSKAIMETELTYKLPDREINLTGTNKVYLGGTKKGNLYKSLKHGNYLFISAMCDE